MDGLAIKLQQLNTLMDENKFPSEYLSKLHMGDVSEDGAYIEATERLERLLLATANILGELNKKY